MCKFKFLKARLSASVCLSALIAISTSLLPIHSAQAQCPADPRGPGFCDTGGNLGAGLTICPKTAHVGDIITITKITMNLGGSQCNASNGQTWVVYPDNTVQRAMLNTCYISGAPDVQCIAPPVDASCQSISTTYQIKPTDVGPKTLSLQTNIPGGSPFLIQTLVLANEVAFAIGGEAQQLNSIGTADFAKGQGEQKVTIVHPSVRISKQCINQCTTIGQPIQFQGWVTNTGDIILTNIVINDTLPSGASVAQPLLFDSTTKNGNAFPPTGTANRLVPGDVIRYSGSYLPAGAGASLCGPFTNTVVVTAKDFAPSACGAFPAATVTDTARAVCYVQTSPGITLSKTCAPVVACQAPNSVNPGAPYVSTFTVINTGNVAVANVVIHDTVTDVTGSHLTDYTCTALLAPGATCTLSVTNTAPTVAQIGSTGNCRVSDRATATAQNICPSDSNNPCPNPQSVTSNPATCELPICCNCDLAISKEVACYLGNNNCGTFSKTATGVRDDSCPAFCYRFTISNPGQVPLVLTSVIDRSSDGTSVDLTSQFNAGGAIPVGQSRTVSVPPRTHCANTTNIVTAICTDPDGTRHEVKDTNIVLVLKIDLDCVDLLLHSSIDTDGISQGEINGDGSVDLADNNHVTLPANTQNAPITLTLTLRNTGTATITVDQLTGVPAGLYDCATGTPVDQATLVPFDIAPGASHTIVLGCVDVSCPGASFSISAHGVASDQGGTLCVFNAQGVRVGDTSDACPAAVDCGVETACRVTGGGILLPGNVDQSCISVPTMIFPSEVNHLTVRKITHGGQLGAPFAHMDCGAILGNICIRGQWSHTRHYEGKGNPRDVIDMDFHSTTPKGVYDSLSCACLGCCDPSTGAFIPAVVGPKIKKFALCNPDDHKICGPQPRPSPANAIIWSGVGKITPTTDSGANGRAAEWVVFRIYIEDRSEPGGNHAGGAVEPADIYCFQAWKTGIAVTKRPDFNTIENPFRRALGEANCAFLEDLSAGGHPIGTLPSPVVDGRTADIQDCGPMYSGNHQIHPVTGADAKCVDAPQQP